ncbi:MAG: type I-E CRISPR-associated protein Cas7/Cse4/CasC, partial [Chloroflexi bacterium]|nr:type I-E CRISPR-associated protein Cas7/Cse4/CasC [Chloroflexota bacterium]
MFIELHLIQNFVPANLNRDDTNNPKDCEFGGVRRARISSQCLKRAIRQAPVFEQTTAMASGLRTKRMVQRLQDALTAAGKEAAEAQEALQEFVPKFASKLDKKEAEKTAVLLYFSPAELADIATALLAKWGDLSEKSKRATAAESIAKELVKQFKDRTSAPDIALFGRMLAEKPELNLDAACQVAHALSTHRVTMEMDFYT